MNEQATQAGRKWKVKLELECEAQHVTYVLKRLSMIRLEYKERLTGECIENCVELGRKDCCIGIT